MANPLKTILGQAPDPGDMEPDELYIEYDHDGSCGVATFVCPCGCPRHIYLNLDQQIKPCWSVDNHEDGTTTISPSINCLTGCKSHFWVKRGIIQWA